MLPNLHCISVYLVVSVVVFQLINQLLIFLSIMQDVYGFNDLLHKVQLITGIALFPGLDNRQGEPGKGYPVLTYCKVFPFRFRPGVLFVFVNLH